MGLKLEVLFLRLCRSGVLLAIDVVRVLARRGRHAERQGVDVDGGTMSSNCAAALADPAAECADADVDRRLSRWTTSFVEVDSVVSSEHIPPRG